MAVIDCSSKIATFLFYVFGIASPITLEAILISGAQDGNYISGVILANSVLLIGVALLAGIGLGYCLKMLNEARDSESVGMSEFHELACNVWCPTPGGSFRYLLKSIWSTYVLIPWFACNIFATWVHMKEISRAANTCAYLPLITYFIGLCAAAAFYNQIKDWCSSDEEDNTEENIQSV